MIPEHIKVQLSELSSAQQIKFQELIAWAGYTGLSGISMNINYENLLEMVKRMGELPIEPKAPTVENDPDFVFKDNFKNLYKDSKK